MFWNWLWPWLHDSGTDWKTTELQFKWMNCISINHFKKKKEKIIYSENNRVSWRILHI